MIALITGLRISSWTARPAQGAVPERKAGSSVRVYCAHNVGQNEEYTGLGTKEYEADIALGPTIKAELEKAQGPIVAHIDYVLQEFGREKRLKLVDVHPVGSLDQFRVNLKTILKVAKMLIFALLLANLTSTAKAGDPPAGLPTELSFYLSNPTEQITLTWSTEDDNWSSAAGNDVLFTDFAGYVDVDYNMSATVDGSGITLIEWDGPGIPGRDISATVPEVTGFAGFFMVGLMGLWKRWHPTSSPS